MSTLKEKIINLRKLGLSYEAIAKEAECATSTVWYYLTPGAAEDRKRRSRIMQKEFVFNLKRSHGGKCIICGYDKCLQALDFHHINLENKDACVAMLSRNGKYRAARAEANKCILLCANCHRELHAGLTKVVAP